jgi:transposase-like protein
MATRDTFKMTTSQRRQRHFSENFKKEKVKEIEIGLSKISDICKQYEVTATNVYRWISKFGSMKHKQERIIVECQSDTKELLELKKKVAELERIIGQKQILLDFKDKMIEIAEETYHVDIKKKFSTKPSDTTGKKEKSSQ